MYAEKFGDTFTGSSRLRQILHVAKFLEPILCLAYMKSLANFHSCSFMLREETDQRIYLFTRFEFFPSSTY